jgi:hypothetical protein
MDFSREEAELHSLMVHSAQIKLFWPIIRNLRYAPVRVESLDRATYWLLTVSQTPKWLKLFHRLRWTF